jgi:hypothetical protein
MRLRGADASRYVPAVPGMKRTRLGGMRSGAAFVDWTDVYVDTQESKRRARIRSYIDYVMCQMCGERIDLHRGSGVTHVAGIALCSTCAEKD